MTISVLGWNTGVLGKLVLFVGLAVVLVVVLRELGIEPPAALPQSLLTVALGALGTIFVLVRVISVPDDFFFAGRGIGLWISLAAAIAVIVAGLLQASEELVGPLGSLLRERLERSDVGLRPAGDRTVVEREPERDAGREQDDPQRDEQRDAQPRAAARILRLDKLVAITARNPVRRGCTRGMRRPRRGSRCGRRLSTAHARRRPRAAIARRLRTPRPARGA